VTVSANILTNTTSAAIRVDEMAGETEPSKNISIIGNVIENVAVGGTSAHGIYVRKSAMLTVSGCTIRDCDKSGIFVTLSNRVTVSGNIVLRSNDVGVVIQDTQDASVAGNVITNNGLTPSTTTPYGLLLQASAAVCKNIVVAGNRIGNSIVPETGYSQTHGIYIVTSTYTVSDVVIDACQLINNTTAPIGGAIGTNVSVGMIGLDVGTTRPTANHAGQRFFDTNASLKIPIWHNGTAWVKADGSAAP
jgi:parallel beta-helix repeat protein